jgi:hypothetical protein
VEGIKRLRIKENAVKIANEACKELRREFIITIFQGRADPAVMGQVMIDRWLKEYGMFDRVLVVSYSFTSR